MATCAFQMRAMSPWRRDANGMYVTTLTLDASSYVVVNAAIMAGENVQENIVRRVFSSAIDLVVHLERDDINKATTDTGIRRGVM